MKTVCEQDKCAGCMACIDICPNNAIKIIDSLRAYNAMIGDQCVNCGICHKICQRNNPATMIAPKYWYQGWANEEDVRVEGSSGGLAMSIANAFVTTGGVVCSCVFEHGKFSFKLIDTAEGLHKFAGSKYVKSDPKGIYKIIKDKLKAGGKVLMISLPCQVSAVKNFVGKELESNLYTIDLICHGTPSPQVLEIFLQQYGMSLSRLHDIRFRNKGKIQVCGNYKGFITAGVSDRYMISFLSSLTYTSNCYECGYAKKERVADLTLGDSWGSELSTKEWQNGISLVLCQTEKGRGLLEKSDIALYPVDIEKAISRNHQLEYPSVKPQGWEFFFDGLNKGAKFNSLVMRILPKKCWKQNLKQLLIRTKIYQGGRGITFTIDKI